MAGCGGRIRTGDLTGYGPGELPLLYTAGGTTKPPRACGLSGAGSPGRRDTSAPQTLHEFEHVCD